MARALPRATALMGPATWLEPLPGALTRRHSMLGLWHARRLAGALTVQIFRVLSRLTCSRAIPNAPVNLVAAVAAGASCGEHSSACPHTRSRACILHSQPCRQRRRLGRHMASRLATSPAASYPMPTDAHQTQRRLHHSKSFLKPSRSRCRRFLLCKPQ